jgi:hypothetical protein
MGSSLPTSSYVHLLIQNGDLEGALEAINSTEDIVDTKEKKKDKDEKSPAVPKIAKNEYRVFKAQILYLLGRYEEVITYLDANKKDILDKLRLHEMYTKACFKINKHADAKPHVEVLQQYLPDNDDYVELAIRIQEAEGKSRSEILKGIYEKNPSALVFRRLIKALDSAADLEYFKTILRKDFIKAVRKILPSYFQGIKDLYHCPKKSQAFEELLKDSLASLGKDNKFPGETQEETPHSLMYVTYILSQHYLKTGRPELALSECQKAEDYCPTFVEIYILKAKIFKKLFNYEAAAACLKDNHTIDKADRYLTNITAKYLLLNNQIQEGDACFKSFIYQSASAERSIHNLQKMFYEIWLGKAFIRQRKWGRGLRQFHFVYTHICEIAEDQLDFFQYMLRKTSLNSLVDVVRFNTETFKSDFRFIRGLGYLLKYGIRYRRNKPVEEAKLQAAAKANPEDEKKLRKAHEKRDRTGVITCEKEVTEELDLEGKNSLENLPLDKAAVLLSKTQTKDPALARLAWGALFDYYYDSKKLLLAVRCIFKLHGLNLEEPAQLVRKALCAHLCKFSLFSEDRKAR